MNTNENITALNNTIAIMIVVSILIALTGTGGFSGALCAIGALFLNLYNHYRIFSLVDRIKGEGNAT